MLSGKGSQDAMTARMLAQKQPSLKECVIAHWSSVLAPTTYRGLSIVPKPWIVLIERAMVGERSERREARPQGLVE